MQVTFKPTNKQHQAFQLLQDNTTTEILYGGASGGGKSYLGCAWIIISALQYPGTRWLIGRSKLASLKQTTLKTFFQICNDWGFKEGTHFKYNAQSNFITFQNDSEIILKDLFLYPSDPMFDSLGSLEITGAFIDEVNQVSKLAVDIVNSRIRYKLDDYGLKPKLYMSCNPSKNWVYSEFYVPYSQGNLLPHRAFIQALLEDNEHITSQYKDQLNKLNKSSKERLLFGNWEYDSDPSYMMDYDSISCLFTNNHIKTGHKYITVDVARMGKDNTVIFVWDGYRVIDLDIIEKDNLSNQKQRIINLQKKYSIKSSNIIIDEDGVGGGLVDMIPLSKGFINNSRALKGENYVNLKSQCYFKLAKDVLDGSIYVEPGVGGRMYKGKHIRDWIIEELSIIKEKNGDKDSKLSVITKQEMKSLLGRSPDFADALMMREYFEFKLNSFGKVHFV